MRRIASWSSIGLVSLLNLACYEGIVVGGEGQATLASDGDGDTGDTGVDPTAGDGDGDPATGDGDPTTGNPTTGDGDGDPTTGDPTTGDGDGDPTTGDGDGDPGNPYDAAADHCVQVINMYRATLDLAPVQRWIAAEDCSNGEAESDAMTNTPHGAFGQCGEFAQNECPGWPGPPNQLLDGCLAQMWAEGPGQDFQLHGHYINMSNPAYTKVACGFYQTGQGDYWAVQNFQ